MVLIFSSKIAIWGVFFPLVIAPVPGTELLRTCYIGIRYRAVYTGIPVFQLSGTPGSGGTLPDSLAALSAAAAGAGAT